MQYTVYACMPVIQWDALHVCDYCILAELRRTASHTYDKSHTTLSLPLQDSSGVAVQTESLGLDYVQGWSSNGHPENEP